MDFIPFYFDSNRWFGLVDGPEKWFELIAAHEGDTDRLLGALNAPLENIMSLPPFYHLDSPEVRRGEIPSFGFRREHLSGTITLEAWSDRVGMDLRAAAVRGLLATAAKAASEDA